MAKLESDLIVHLTLKINHELIPSRMHSIDQKRH